MSRLTTKDTKMPNIFNSKEAITISGRYFFNYPKQVSVGDYGSVRNQIIKFYQENSDIISIYEYGSVSAPGVSDLDLIFVLKDQILSNENEFDLSNISSFAHDLVADGTVIKMPLNIFQKIQYFDNLNFHKLSGKDILFDKPTESDDKFIKLASIVDWVPERILKLTRILNSEDINITNALCVLHSFGYSLKYLDNILGASEESRKVIEETARLRGEWHQIDHPEEDLVKCLGKAIDIGYKRLFDYEDYLRCDTDYLLEDFNCNFDIDLELYKNHFIRFSSSRIDCYESSIKNIQCNNKYYVVVSMYFYPHFAILASQRGKLSECMLNKIQPSAPIKSSIVNKSYKDNLLRKINLAELNAQFLQKNNLKTGLIRYGFHF